jgi:hypothetical protein
MQQLRTGPLPYVLTYLPRWLIEPRGARAPTNPQKAPSHHQLLGRITYTAAQGNSELARHTSDKLLASESAVPVLSGLVRTVRHGFHQMLAQMETLVSIETLG